jgi:hypothetical protein
MMLIYLLDSAGSDRTAANVEDSAVMTPTPLALSGFSYHRLAHFGVALAEENVVTFPGRVE